MPVDGRIGGALKFVLYEVIDGPPIELPVCGIVYIPP